MSSHLNSPPADNPWSEGPSDTDYEPPSVDEDTEVEIFEDMDSDEDDDDDDDDESPAYVDARELVEELLQEHSEDEDGETEQSQQNDAAQAAGGGQDARRPISITRHELLQLLTQSRSFRHLFTTVRRGTDTAGDEDDDEEVTNGPVRTRRRRRRSDLYPKVPSEAGRELMDSGEFGLNERDLGQYDRKKRLATSIMRRELGLEPPGKQRSANRIASQSLLPASNADTIIHYDNRCYSGQFSDDGNFFFSCSQDFRVRMYDTSNPYSWRYYKSVIYPYGQWTITDASLSPDNKFLAYSSIRSMVCLASTDPEQSEPHLLDFADMGRRNLGRGHFGIWSIRFSGDGREIVAGTSDHSVYVYDLETRQSILRINGHDDDVNAVCFGDKSSPHLLYSGSDDTTLKVWDRRSLGDSREAGVFIGHTEGLTYVDSKGDGRYVLSNSKDQTMKLWDLRKMIPTEKAERIDLSRYNTGFDYRFQSYEEEYYKPNPHDCSLVTFRGHKVLKTLIRCHFSPPGSTDSRYVYTGSEDGGVYIYNLDATLAKKLDVQAATQDSRPRDDVDTDILGAFHDHSGSSWKTCVRDASWHPYAPVLAATSWNGYGTQNGTCTVHTWNDGMEEDEAEPKMGQRVNAQLGSDDSFYERPVTFGRTTARMHRLARLRREADIDEDD